MLFLCFQLGTDRYALECSQVIEVVPLLGLKRIPHAPAAVAGVCNYRGKPVPVIDLSELALGRPARHLTSTRLIVVTYPAAGGDHAHHLLGLIAERATGTVRRAPSDFTDAGVINGDAPYLGPVAIDQNGLLQWIEVKELLPPSVRDVLFNQTLEQQ
jgi:chemotaxis-related protein WspB